MSEDRELPADVAETHVSVVFFIGDRAYKLKKAVSTDFLDFRTREARAAVCRREVELNRRFAPDVYLGVADVMGPDGELCDHLVVMRRMPTDRRLSTLVRVRAPDVEAQVRRVARKVAAFHASAPTSPEIARAGAPDAVAALWMSNLREMEPFDGSVLEANGLERVRRLAAAYLAGRKELFQHRVTAGFVRDGHSDLLADDIFCLEDEPRVLDCVEFDDRLRHGDVLADTASLAMDLERLGRPDLGELFLTSYEEFSAEIHPASLAHHWTAYRALVRSKVACIRHSQGGEAAGEDASRLLAMCVRHLERARVRLVLVGGLPGTGKSTLATGLADRLGWTVLRSDEVRKELGGMAATTPAPAEYRHGLYTEEMTAATYRELVRRAGQALAMGETVVLDASWTTEGDRAHAATVAAATSSELVALRCVAPMHTAAARLRQRSARRAGGESDASDATPAIAIALAAREDPWRSAAIVDTSRSTDEALDEALAAVQAS